MKKQNFFLKEKKLVQTISSKSYKIYVEYCKVKLSEKNFLLNTRKV